MFQWRLSLVLLASFCFITYGLRDRSEPVCSKFHYEEQLLEKMIRLEIKFESLIEKFQQSEAVIKEERHERLKEKQELQTWLDVSKTDLSNKIEEMTDAIDAGEIKLSQQIAETKTFMDTSAAMIKDMVNTSPVAFEVHGVVNKGPQNGDIIVFRDSKVNEGGGYDNTTGVFTVPEDGVYIVMVQFCLQNKKTLTFKIVVDTTVETAMKFGNFDDDGNYVCFSSQTVIKATAYAKLLVKSTNNHKSSTLYDGDYWTNVFSGVLIGKV